MISPSIIFRVKSNLFLPSRPFDSQPTDRSEATDPPTAPRPLAPPTLLPNSSPFYFKTPTTATTTQQKKTERNVSAPIHLGRGSFVSLFEYVLVMAQPDHAPCTLLYPLSLQSQPPMNRMDGGWKLENRKKHTVSTFIGRLLSILFLCCHSKWFRCRTSRSHFASEQLGETWYTTR